MSPFDILAWLVLLYKDKFENNKSFINQITYITLLSFYKLYKSLYIIYNGGLSRIDKLNSEQGNLRVVLNGIIAHSELDNKLIDDNISDNGSETSPLLEKNETKLIPPITLSKTFRSNVNSSLKDLLQLPLKQTNWEDNNKQYIEIYNSVFNHDPNEDYIDNENILINGLRKRGEKEESPSPSPSSNITHHNNTPSKANWVSVGFQGSDPSTDFRGSGTFGLECFYQFCTKFHPGLISKTIMIQSGSFEPNQDTTKPWYSVALVSIHLSQFLITLLKRETFKPAIYKGIINSISLEQLQDSNPKSIYSSIYSLHSILLIKFHNSWLKSVSTGEIKTVMDTESFLQKFQSKIEPWLWKANWNDSDDIYEILDN